MARVEMNGGIASISGKLGDYCFRTMRSTGKVYMHTITKNGRTNMKSERKAPSAAMVQQRERFGALTKMVAQMRKNGSKKSQKQLWKIAKAAYDAANQ